MLLGGSTGSGAATGIRLGRLGGGVMLEALEGLVDFTSAVTGVTLAATGILLGPPVKGPLLGLLEWNVGLAGLKLVGAGILLGGLPSAGLTATGIVW